MSATVENTGEYMPRKRFPTSQIEHFVCDMYINWNHSVQTTPFNCARPNAILIVVRK